MVLAILYKSAMFYQLWSAILYDTGISSHWYIITLVYNHIGNIYIPTQCLIKPQYKI